MKIFKEVSRLKRVVTKTKNYSNCREIHFEPQNIKVERFKIHDPCNRCIYVTVSTETTFRTKMRVKVIVGDLGRVRGILLDRWISERRKRFGKEVAQ